MRYHLTWITLSIVAVVSGCQGTQQSLSRPSFSPALKVREALLSEDRKRLKDTLDSLPENLDVPWSNELLCLAAHMVLEDESSASMLPLLLESTRLARTPLFTLFLTASRPGREGLTSVLSETEKSTATFPKSCRPLELAAGLAIQRGDLETAFQITSSLPRSAETLLGIAADSKKSLSLQRFFALAGWSPRGQRVPLNSLAYSDRVLTLLACNEFASWSVLKTLLDPSSLLAARLAHCPGDERGIPIRQLAQLVNSPAPCGSTPLSAALSSADPYRSPEAAVAVLLRNGADPNRPSRSYCYAPPPFLPNEPLPPLLLWAHNVWGLRRDDDGAHRIFRLLLDRGANSKAVDSKGNSVRAILKHRVWLLEKR